MAQVLSGQVLPPSARVPGVPAAIEAAMLWMLEKAPRERPPSGAALVALLEGVLRAPHDTQRVRSAREAHQRATWRLDVATVAARTAGGVVAVLSVAWLLWEVGESRPV